MTGTRTPNYKLYLPDDDDEGWGDDINQNFVIIDQHLAGSLFELRDVDVEPCSVLIDIVPDHLQILAFDRDKGAWTNINSNLLGIQEHNELKKLNQDDHGIYVLLDGSLALDGNLNVGNNKIINVSNATALTDAVTLEQLEGGLQEIKNDYVVLDIITDPTTLTPSNGDIYLVSATSTGTWTSSRNHIIHYTTKWNTIPPKIGMIVYVKSQNKLYIYNGTWVAFSQFLNINHSEISNLNNDDHVQYLTDARHNTLDHSKIIYPEYPSGQVKKQDKIVIQDSATGENRIITIDELMKALSNFYKTWPPYS